jgi:protein-tyrosine phosphatase
LVELVDIHCHLLPGIDDGPPTLEESLDMARAAVAAGITTIAATPHLRSDFPGVRVEEIGERVAALQNELDDRQIPLTVISGAEVSLVWALEATDEELRLASYGQRGTDLLIETPSDVSRLEQLLFQVRGNGYRVTLAHPERSSEFRRDPAVLARLRDQGVLLQVNARPLTGRRGSNGRAIDALCRDGLVHAVASDGHRGAAWRPVTALADARESLSSLVGPGRAEWLVAEAPRAIIDGRPLPSEPPTRVTGRRRLFSRH